MSNIIIRKFSVFLSIICSLFFIISCQDPFDIMKNNPQFANNESTLVRIYIGEDNSSARTIQPNHDMLAGYQLTFAPGTHNPVNITVGNSADVSLANGNWTITAMAYKSGGVIGNLDDAVAYGFINISISGGIVSGTVPPIILRPTNAVGNGTFQYNITLDEGISGYIKLWDIDGLSPISTFGTGGTLTLSNSTATNFIIPAGRYITEVKLTNTEGNVSFRREVVEIWAGTTTVFSHAPVDFGDPNAILANSEARLCEINTTFNGNSIGAGIGSGNSEQDPKIYNIGTVNTENLLISLEFEQDSSFSTYSWMVNTGNEPGGIYTGAGVLPVDYSINDVLWIKATPEDGISEAIYYKFIILPFVSGNYGDFNVDSNVASGVSFWAGELNIIRDGTYTISMNGVSSTTTNFIKVSSGVSADITISDVSINMSSNGFACAFDMTGATVRLTLIGNNIFRSGSERSGLDVALGGTLIITANSSGSLTAIGASGFTLNLDGQPGIGNSIYGSNRERGTIEIYGGTVIAIGGDAGSYSGGSGIHVNNLIIHGGVFTATGGSGSQTTGVGGRGIDATGGISIFDGVITASLGGGRWRDYNCIVATNIIISGGLITANGGNSSLAAGISAGQINISNGNISSSGIYGISGTNIDISGGMIVATGSSGGAGINGNTVSISGGTITATGGSNGAGIAGVTLSITGGKIIANGGSGIGSSSISNISGNAVIFASSIQPALPTGANLGPAIIFSGSNVNIYGDFILTQDVIIDGVLNIGRNQVLPIQSGYSLINNGEIHIYGRVDGSIINNGNIYIYEGANNNSTIIGNEPEIIEHSFIITSDSIYFFNGDVITINNNGNYSIGMKHGVSFSTEKQIVVAPGVVANITLTDVYIEYSASALDIINASVNLTLVGNNVLYGGEEGIKVPIGATLVITEESTGLLDVNGYEGAGIGGGGTVTINGGTVTANSYYGAGIGGSYGGGGGNITINGGTVTATVFGEGAGIGGSSGGAGGSIIINGGTIIANGIAGASIGGGYGGEGGNITINGGTIIAINEGDGAGIGGGHDGAGGFIKISGGTIIATGVTGAGIGAGTDHDDGGYIETINGNAIIFASSIHPELPVDENLGPAIIFNGENGTLFGDFTLLQDITIEDYMTLNVPRGGILTIPGDITLTNNGTIIIEDGGIFNGTVSGNEPIWQ